jgi:hypothetical protein
VLVAGVERAREQQDNHPQGAVKSEQPQRNQALPHESPVDPRIHHDLRGGRDERKENTGAAAS